MRCEDCEDLYCALCFAAQHRAGSRREHVTTALAVASVTPASTPIEAGAAVPTTHEAQDLDAATPMDISNDSQPQTATAAVDGESESSGGALDEPVGTKDVAIEESSTSASDSDEDEEMDTDREEDTALLRDASHIPMRLTDEERSLFNLLDASLNVSEYTDKVDVLSYRSPVKRVIHELNEIFSVLSGMMIANDFRKGRRLVQDRKFEENEEFFRQVFEIGRRYKIMNPGEWLWHWIRSTAASSNIWMCRRANAQQLWKDGLPAAGR